MTIQFNPKPQVSLRALVAPILVIAFLMLAGSSRADSSPVYTYSYSGNAFNQFGGGAACPSDCGITGWFTVSGPLPADASGFFDPLSFWFTDGNTVFTPTSVTSDAFGVVTGNQGQILLWNLNWINGSLGMYSNTGVTSVCTDTVNCRVVDGIFSPNYYAEVNNDPGKWSVSVQAPEPASLILVGLGILCLALANLKTRIV